MPYSFVYFSAQKNSSLNLFVTNNTLLYLMVHVKLSTLFYSSQLSDILAYELPIIGTSKISHNLKTPSPITNLKTLIQPSVVVYNLHSMHYHSRLFIFSQHNHSLMDKRLQSNSYTLSSVSEIFPAGN